jgi:serine palmitoyltransferase
MTLGQSDSSAHNVNQSYHVHHHIDNASSSCPLSLGKTDTWVSKVQYRANSTPKPRNDEEEETETQGQIEQMEDIIQKTRGNNSWSASKKYNLNNEHPNMAEATWFAAMTTFFAYAVIIFFGFLRELGARVTGCSRYANDGGPNPNKQLLRNRDHFFTRRIYHRGQECWNRPIQGPPKSSALTVLHRTSHDGKRTLHCTGNSSTCINLGSYNYLGFADDWETHCQEAVQGTLKSFPASTCSASSDGGYSCLHKQLESMIAAFVGKPSAVVFNTGYGTNLSAIPTFMGRGTLIVSDSLNHTSMVNGSRSSSAVIRVFRHNDMEHLEQVLWSAIVNGQPRTNAPWRKIVVLVEGIYSMEGDILDLPSVVRICRKYKSYLYVDEAHSIGALGPSGRGVCDYWGVDPQHVDVLMGTFTKSFGGMGGYVAGSKEFISFLNHQTAGTVYATSMPPPVCQQIISTLCVISGAKGEKAGSLKLARVRRNANYFRARLIHMGLTVLGDWDSPVIPVLIFHPMKLAVLSKRLFELGLATVIVGFPATPLTLSRCRFCVSAAHTKNDLDKALNLIDWVTDEVQVKYKARTFG